MMNADNYTNDAKRKTSDKERVRGANSTILVGQLDLRVLLLLKRVRTIFDLFSRVTAEVGKAR
jgi:hypothetical protein